MKRVLVLLVAAARAAAADPLAAADEVLAAVRASDGAKLALLAARDDPDPWLVADELLFRQEPDTAEAFAKATPRKATEGLPGYVRSRRGEPPNAAAHESAALLRALLKKGDHAGVLKAAEGVDAPLDTVAGVLVAYTTGVALLRSGRPEEALNRLGAAADAAEAIGWLRRAAWSRLQEGNCINDGRRRRELVAVWEKALGLSEGAGDARLKGVLLQSLGKTYGLMGQFDRALECQEGAIRVGEETGDRAAVGTSLGDIGLVYKDRGDFPRALECKQKALAILEEAGEHALVASTMGDIGCLLQSVGDLRKALEFQERALELFGAAGDRDGIAGAHINLSSAYDALGDYAEAFAHGEKALRLMEELNNKAGMATAAGNLGNLYRRIGDGARALSCYERALRLGEEAGRSDLTAATLGNLGAAYVTLGNLPKALEYMEQALKLREELGNKAWAAIALDNIGVIHGALGDHDKALACAERALTLSEEAGDRAGMATAHANIGRAFKDRGDLDKALAHLEAALRLEEEIGDAEGTARTQWGLCAVHAARGDPQHAVACAREAVTIASGLGHRLSDELEASARQQFGDLYGCGALSAAALGDPAGVAFFLENGRAGALREVLKSRDAIRSFALPAALRESEVTAAGRESSATAALRQAVAAGDVAAVREARSALDAAREEVREVANRVQMEAKSAADVLCAQADSLPLVEARLGPDEALVLYGMFAGEDALALVVTAKNARIVPLGKTRDIEDACAALRAGDKGANVTAAVDRLRRLAFDPLRVQAPRLLLSPDGALSYVPFALLAPERELVQVPSGTVYGILLEEKGKRGEGVLALGDPDYGAMPREGLVALRGGSLARLPATAAEAKAVGDVVLLGKEATESGLRDALAKRPRWRAVHLACHGFVDPERPMLSSLALTPAGEDDGFLTALDVFRMSVPADLAVLSACETGRGRIYKAEGIVGLARAFMFAGAPRVLVSLWKVDDEATQALMAKFYEAWTAGRPAAAALRDAQAFVRGQEKWRHPAYWAAWVLWGLPE